MAHLHRGRVHIAAADAGNVAQPQLVGRCVATGTADGHGAQVVQRVELASHPHLHHVQRGLHRASAFHRVLLAQLRQHLVEVQPELGQALLRDLDEDFLVLDAEQLDLGDVGHPQQLLAHIVGKVLGFGVAEAVGLERIDDAIDVAELVVVERPLHARRQLAPRTSPIFLRTWYQTLGTSAGLDESLIWKMICDSPGLE